MQITNTSARIVFMQITEKLIYIRPLDTITLTGSDAAEATAVVAGPLKPLVLSGELIVLREAGDPDPDAQPPECPEAPPTEPEAPPTEPEAPPTEPEAPPAARKTTRTRGY